MREAPQRLFSTDDDYYEKGIGWIHIEKFRRELFMLVPIWFPRRMIFKRHLSVFAAHGVPALRVLIAPLRLRFTVHRVNLTIEGDDKHERIAHGYHTDDLFNFSTPQGKGCMRESVITRLYKEI